MQDQIPILINRRGSKKNQLAFRIFPLDKSSKISHQRQNTHLSIEKPKLQQRKHVTLDSKSSKSQNRYRRISSSGATNKFPKDFFKQNLPNAPIRIRFNRSKKQSSLQSQRLSNIHYSDLSIKFLKNQLTAQSPQKMPVQKQQRLVQVQTPKFNNKNQNIQNDGQIFYQGKSKTTNRKIKIQDYLSHKKYKENIPKFFLSNQFEQINEQQNGNQNPNSILTQTFRCQYKYGSLSTEKNKQQNKTDILLQDLNKINKNKACEQVNSNSKYSNKYSNDKQKNLFFQNNTVKNRKNSKKVQKQNINHETVKIHKAQQKNIKSFLSTKGLNTKKGNLNSNTIKVNENQLIQNKIIANHKNVQEQKLMTFLFKKKRNNSLQQQLEHNTFRIRKYA